VEFRGQGGGFSVFEIGGLRLHSATMTYMKVNCKVFLHISGAGGWPLFGRPIAAAGRVYKDR
jgi:hypothetical protein